MAYGVKYRLEFSDVLGYRKKIEIHKKDYTGSVLPIIGTSSPVVVSWQSSDDFYKPIIGSKCQLNLMVTDSVTYDDFYKFDEREYKVIIFYAQTQADEYSDRVSADGGQTESINCLNNVISDYSSSDVWAVYWSGFLVVDRYKEKITSTPFGVSFNAFDGLGTLNNFNAPNGYNSNNAPVTTTNIERISKILQNLDLDLDIYIASDIKFRQYGPAADFEFEELTTLNFGYDEMSADFALNTAKFQLELILKQFNLRIFQSMNKWYIVEGTNMFDYYVKDLIFNELQQGGTPTAIRAKILTQFQSTNKEFLDFRKYNYLGASLAKERKQVLYSTTDLKAVGNNLVREYLQPASEVQLTGNYIKTKNSFYNAGFEYGNFGFTIEEKTIGIGVTTPYAVIATDEVSFKGKRSLKLADVAPITGATEMFYFDTPTFNPQELSYNQFSCKLKYYLSLPTSQSTTTTATIQYVIQTTLNGSARRWNNVAKEFQASAPINEVTVSSLNKWVDLSVQLSDQGLSSNSSTSSSIRFLILNVICSDSDYETTYFDNFLVDQSKSSADESSQTFVSKLTGNGVNTSIQKLTRLADQKFGYYRTRDHFPVLTFKPNSKTLMTVLGQNVANDYREYVSRYTGTFRNINRVPMSFHNKIWFSWIGIETDPQSNVLDGLTYDVKNAQYSVKSHLPNNDDDVTVTRIIN